MKEMEENIFELTHLKQLSSGFHTQTVDEGG